MKEKFNELFSGKLEIERASRNVVVICDKNYDLCEIDDGLTYEDGKALERAKYIANATNNFADMYEILQRVIECAEDSQNEIHHSDLIHSLHDDINKLLKRSGS